MYPEKLTLAGAELNPNEPLLKLLALFIFMPFATKAQGQATISPAKEVVLLKEEFAGPPVNPGNAATRHDVYLCKTLTFLPCKWLLFYRFLSIRCYSKSLRPIS
jgi:hypothetical protein